jgi:hypothetical protein
LPFGCAANARSARPFAEKRYFALSPRMLETFRKP